jgi:hypothetical protein
MTEEEILQRAENHLIFERHNDVWKTDTLQLLKFARELYEQGYEEGGYGRGYDVGEE